MISTNNIHWAAGFLEGEGSYSAGRLKSDKGYSKGIRVSAAQVQKEPLERLQRLFGGSLAQYVGGRLGNYIWLWGLGAEKSAGLMMTIYPLMSSKRKSQIERALTNWKATP